MKELEDRFCVTVLDVEERFPINVKVPSIVALNTDVELALVYAVQVAVPEN